MGADLSRRRRRLLDTIADVVPTRHPHCVRVGIDGVDGAGKSTLAAQLAAALRHHHREVVQVSADDFHHPAAIRYRLGRQSAAGFWLDSYDYPALTENVLDPFSPGGSRRYRTAIHDLARDRPVDLPWQTAPASSVLIVDGLFLHRDELAPVWDLSLFLHVPFSETARRMAGRDGSQADPDHPSLRRYVEGQRLYFAACSPWQRANLVIDNSDPDAPNIINANSIH